MEIDWILDEEIDRAPRRDLLERLIEINQVDIKRKRSYSGYDYRYAKYFECETGRDACAGCEHYNGVYHAKKSFFVVIRCKMPGRNNDRYRPEGIQKGENIDLMYDDGGRAKAGFRGSARDCGVRAIAIATGKSYKEVYKAANKMCKVDGFSNTFSSARNGLFRTTFIRIMKWLLGYEPEYHDFYKNGGKRKACRDDFPNGRLILKMKKPYAAVVDGVIYDSWDSRDRDVLGYWTIK